MIEEVVLFCGGKPLHPGSVPKPLTLMPNSISILGNYLRQKFLREVNQITLLAEEDYVEKLMSVIHGNELSHLNIRCITLQNGSSTFNKVHTLLSSKVKLAGSLLFTYPDIFYFGDFAEIFSDADLDSMFVTGVYLQSRFPEITFNPYSGDIRSISLRPPRVPASSSTIFAGHFFARYEQIRLDWEKFCSANRMRNDLSFEGDFFKYLVNENKLKVQILGRKWIKADSSNEMSLILDLLSSDN